MFVDAHMRPRLHRRGMLDALLDETDIVSVIGDLLSVSSPLSPQSSQETFEKAYNFRRDRLLRWTFE